ncbi:MAG TPA: SOS response-associated peptidase [Aestuariivirgaceae bacterium]|nr:SOS response-associated peptidase [Aestuariivirgaceae bacterium]
MCGLYSFRRGPEEVRRLFGYVERDEFPPRPHVAPGSPIAIVRPENGVRRLALVRWGFVPAWKKDFGSGKPMVNARAETVLDKPTFRNAMRRRRCLVPADGFYAWKGDVPGRKQAFFIHRPDHELFGFAGLWEHWMGADGSEIETALIITTPANAALAHIHHRLPAVIAPEDFDRWLDADGCEAGEAAGLLQPAPDDYFIADPVDLTRRPKAEAEAKPKVSEPERQPRLL